jgi:hypothetical protein
LLIFSSVIIDDLYILPALAVLIFIILNAKKYSNLLFVFKNILLNNDSLKI